MTIFDFEVRKVNFANVSENDFAQVAAMPDPAAGPPARLAAGAATANITRAMS